ncbi:unnamed protein product [Cylicocyclus nassatus]|uniref:Uncharacterized protein n=1 Tax=Cylicocyclus nassatus TaxID=53992 RepID=A0AA36DQG9_CYLNA|nr:unnamed protein product [Cylicocyclus nassatus]
MIKPCTVVAAWKFSIVLAFLNVLARRRADTLKKNLMALRNPVNRPSWKFISSRPNACNNQMTSTSCCHRLSSNSHADQRMQRMF